MARLLYLAHRMPYPPDKGDKVRSFNLLQYLAARHEVHVGTFIDDPADAVHIPTLRRLCATLHVEPLHPATARVRSLTALLHGEPLSQRYYRNATLRRWVQTTAREQRIDAVVAVSSPMAQYADGLGLPLLVDFVDLDSAKWTQYAAERSGPSAWIYGREGRTLLALERRIALAAQRSFFVSENEAALFAERAPDAGARSQMLGYGVDAVSFAPDAARPSPFAAGETPLVFTGAMDYWPNVDGVRWFVADVLPAVHARWPKVRLHIVGRNPTPAVRALAGDAVVVTGTVPDVRPYLQHAAVVVAPLRLARGIQNKVLEAMAMGRPVVVSSVCAAALTAEPGTDLLTAADAGEHAAAIDTLLRDPALAAAVGTTARERVLRDYVWEAQLAAIDAFLPTATTPVAPRRAAAPALA